MHIQPHVNTVLIQNLIEAIRWASNIGPSSFVVLIVGLLVRGGVIDRPTRVLIQNAFEARRLGFDMKTV